MRILESNIIWKTEDQLQRELLTRSMRTAPQCAVFTAYVEKIFAILRDNFKKELAPLLYVCLRAPKTSDGAASEGSDNNNPRQSLIDHLDSFLNTLKENHVPRVIVQKIYMQTFSYINVQLLNRHRVMSFLYYWACSIIVPEPYKGKSTAVELVH